MGLPSYLGLSPFIAKEGSWDQRWSQHAYNLLWETRPAIWFQSNPGGAGSEFSGWTEMTVCEEDNNISEHRAPYREPHSSHIVEIQAFLSPLGLDL